MMFYLVRALARWLLKLVNVSMRASYFQLIDIDHDGTWADTVDDLHQAFVPVQKTLPTNLQRKPCPFPHSYKRLSS